MGKVPFNHPCPWCGEIDDKWDSEDRPETSVKLKILSRNQLASARRDGKRGHIRWTHQCLASSQKEIDAAVEAVCEEPEQWKSLAGKLAECLKDVRNGVLLACEPVSNKSAEMLVSAARVYDALEKVNADIAEYETAAKHNGH